MSETRKLLLKAVGFCLSPAQIAKLKQGFEQIDENRNGVICVQELKTAIENQYSNGTIVA
jgi:Ca2+-binding EF-hand superfamily protein